MRIRMVVWMVGLMVSAAGALSGAAAGAGYVVYVSNERSGDVSVIDGVSLTVTSTWTAGKRPRGIHLSNDGAMLYVAVSGSPRLGPGADPERARNEKADKSADGVVMLDPRTGTSKGKLTVGSDPEEFAVSADGKTLIVSNEDEGFATAWEIGSGRKLFGTAVSEEPEGVAIHPTRPEVYITCEALGEIFVLDVHDGGTRAKVRVGGRPRTIAFTMDGRLAFAPIEGGAEVVAIDATSYHVAFRVPIAGADVLPMGAVVSPTGAELFVSTGRGNTVAVIDVGQRKVSASVPVGRRPWGIALSPDGRTLFTANGGSNDVSVVDVAQRREIKRIAVGDGPWGIAIGLAPGS